MRPPEVASSTEEERREYIKETFPCIADCDMCGLCAVFRGKTRNWHMPIISAGSGSTWKCRKITDKKYGQPEHGVPDIRQSAAGTAVHGRK